ncbi:hypothetical protein OIU74_030210 [Salix koriyanagi]|uniref:Uncharacterized protein n=1 Tax=Salix koriyanagi TaxID=2511006 RepID=A0A9Q0VFZ0_9ROSI|nr:hypothetical protein OIU74_030210 [Salix koriyanagi]
MSHLYLLVVLIYIDGHVLVSDLSFHSIAVFASFIKYQSKLEECQINFQLFITCAIQGSSASCLKSNSYVWAAVCSLFLIFTCICFLLDHYVNNYVCCCFGPSLIVDDYDDDDIQW